ncbi:MAG TPA: SDR family oxidoreductase [Candidatus Dormibacteraeota bacterium]|jgi:NAD(P)-dependent dehydrogenase (short-subunit alcohol dehydrogenase family)|nr:SDR family oxidoreductase [Candidatus Dormibacteraeota bacterium]
MAGIEGRVALVSGGTSGIGLGIARLLLEEGASVVVTGRDPELGAAAGADLDGIGPVSFCAADARRPESAVAAARLAEERFGGLDIVVANAGVGVVCPLADTSDVDWRWTWETNVSGYLYLCQEGMRTMRRRGSGGAMVLIASDAGVVGERAIGAYSVTKAAVVMMARVLSLDGAPDGIRVNCVCPGYVEPGMRHMPDRAQAGGGEDGFGFVDPPKPPLGRHGTARDIAQAVRYLVGPESSFATGSVLLVEGGATAGLP